MRKHCSRLKGGQLARGAAPARVHALLLSDVIGDAPDVIGSGPTAPDESTFAQAMGILARLGIRAQVPASVLDRLQRGLRGEIPETPKPGDRIFDRVQNTPSRKLRAAWPRARPPPGSSGPVLFRLSAVTRPAPRSPPASAPARARAPPVHVPLLARPGAPPPAPPAPAALATCHRASPRGQGGFRAGRERPVGTPIRSRRGSPSISRRLPALGSSPLWEVDRRCLI